MKKTKIFFSAISFIIFCASVNAQNNTPEVAEKNVAAKNLEKPALKINQKGLPIEVPLIAVPPDVKEYINTLGSFVEYQRLCKDSPENKKAFQEYLKNTEDTTHLVYGVAPLDYRKLLEAGADSAETYYTGLPSAEQVTVCKNFGVAFKDFLKNVQNEAKNKDLAMIDLNREVAIKSKLKEESLKSPTSPKKVIK